MILYLIKTIACMLLLFAAYRLLLQRERMYRFNRFFLLLSVVVSLIVPALTIKLPGNSIKTVTQITAIHLPVDDSKFIAPPTDSISINGDKQSVDINAFDIYDYAAIIYIAVLLILSVRFIVNLSTLIRRIHGSDTTTILGTTLVLVDDAIVPYSFLNYIFVQKLAYENSAIEPELFRHELAHVSQKHTLDILFIEVLKIAFWFNPMLYLYKRAIQLNHEFLADERVIKRETDIRAYQYLLLSKAGFDTKMMLTSNFNYSITKKRLTMMNKTTSKLRAVFMAIAVAPALLTTGFFISFKANAQEAAPTKVPADTIGKKAGTIKQRPIVVYADHYDPDSIFIHFTDKNGNKYIKTYSELPPDQQKRFAMFTTKHYEKIENKPSAAQVKTWKNPKVYGVWINEKHVKNSEIDNYNASDFVHYFQSKLYGPAKKGRIYSYQVDLYTRPYYDKVTKESAIRNAAKTHQIVFAKAL